ncbi:hypothetical protein ACOSQ4_008895 [Xanthoceras sorbifolium]
MIPINILSKMGIYELKLNPRLKVVKAIVIDSAALIDSNITELRSLLQKPVVGFDVKFDTDHDDQNKKRIAKLLLLYVDCRCLIIQLHSLASNNSWQTRQFVLWVLVLKTRLQVYRDMVCHV